ncbi:MAG: biosynthetic arginine decarboxylase [Planctomycetes bacterium]|nr:biosynthetic arginine decarboxylase [Planctomycetota bacterium]
MAHAEIRDSTRGWTSRDAAELYNVHSWGAPYFGVNEAGHVVVHPNGNEGFQMDLYELVSDLRRRGFSPPLLIRFSDILKARVDELCGAFQMAIKDSEYQGAYRGVYPIKVNQQRHVVEELAEYGRPHHLGLEAGSKPELLVAVALLDDPEALIICNGYKDKAYIETALLSQKLGRRTIIVVDRYREIDTILQVSKELGIRPNIGVRARLTTKGAGKWVESTGDRSKFGLTTTEIVEVVERLKKEDMLDCLQLLHYHIGSQITAIRAHKDALREACRILTELYKMGASMRYIDCGGGLGVDYDGSSTNFHSSMNYNLREYAADVVAALAEACKTAGMPHPDIVTESGRALTAHHSVLVFNVLGANEVLGNRPPQPVKPEEHAIVRKLDEILQGVTRKNVQESYNDALEVKEESIVAFSLGVLNLRERARCEEMFWAICERILKVIKELEYVPEELEGLEKALSDTYYCNFSLFQSAPDHWAVKQLFPCMPIQRLTERPQRRAILADLTCDSDGKIDEFIDLRDVKHALEVHPIDNGKPYFIALFLVGAYQEVLGDLHNLFADTDAVHVKLVEGGYMVEHAVKGDTIGAVLEYMEYDKNDLVRRMRKAVEQSLRGKQITLDESGKLMQRYEDALNSYTYLATGE